ncbi:unnamed protein product, partial [Ectocarpus sp. 13 AM-2016]
EFGEGLGAENCCVSDIVEHGELCSIALEAPCYIDDSAPAPSPVAMPTAPVAEPTAPVAEPTVPVAEPTAPTEPTCSTGIPGIESSDSMVCCPVGCTMCGGSGCSTVGMPDYGAESCCSSDVLSTGAWCSEKEEAPCVLVDAPAPTPSPV